MMIAYYSLRAAKGTSGMQAKMLYHLYIPFGSE
jgi:hypothetical protein